jgi:hypothetical protein
MHDRGKNPTSAKCVYLLCNHKLYLTCIICTLIILPCNNHSDNGIQNVFGKSNAESDFAILRLWFLAVFFPVVQWVYGRTHTMKSNHHRRHSAAAGTLTLVDLLKIKKICLP